jgi:hypothetical protein
MYHGLYSSAAAQTPHREGIDGSMALFPSMTGLVYRYRFFVQGASTDAPPWILDFMVTASMNMSQRTTCYKVRKSVSYGRCASFVGERANK